jgi:predicted GTPase
MLMADIAIINKVDTADPEKVEEVEASIREHNSKADRILAESPVLISHPERVKGRRVLVVEDGPTITHGEMPTGAGFIAARQFGASEIVDPRPFAKGSIQKTYEKYPHTGPVLPAMGYSPAQIRDLETTIKRSDAELVLFATPIQLTRIVNITKEALRVRYEYRDHASPTLEEVLLKRLEKAGGKEKA